VKRRSATYLVVAGTSLLWWGRALPSQAGDPDRRPWLGPDGEALPFTTDEEVLEFLRTAEVVKAQEIPVGITRPLKLLLERDGVRARAAFRYVDEERKSVSVEGRHYQRFRDCCRFECAAYQLARRLGLDCVPPTVERKVEGRSGTVQMWVEETLDETKEDFQPPSVYAWIKQTWDKDLFDNLILNVDRNSGNVLVDESYKMWLIDHTRAFQPAPELLEPEGLTRINREVWMRLENMNEDALKEAVGPYLDGQELMCLARRRELLLERIDALVAERGESVFY
jgi:hypothetical protein